MTDTMGLPPEAMPIEPETMPDPQSLPPPSAPDMAMSEEPMPAAMGAEEPMPAATGAEEPQAEPTVDMSILELTKPKGTKEELEQIAKDYIIPVAISTIEQWATALKGKDTKPFQEYAAQVATGLFPMFAAQIKMGITPRMLVDPYVQVAQMILGPMDDEPDWSDPKWSKALHGGVDPKTGGPGLMDLAQWKDTLRSDPAHGWEFTPPAHQRANEFVNHMQESFAGKEGEI